MKLPYFPFYPDDWLSSSKVMLMTMEQRGIYITLLAHAWKFPSGSLPNEIEILRRFCPGARTKNIQYVLDNCFHVASHLPELGFYNARLLHELSTARVKHEKASETAKHREELKRQSRNVPETYQKRDHNQNQNQNQNQITPKVKRKSRPAQAHFVLPEWIGMESWTAYIEMRNAKKKPATEKAKALVVKELERLKASGQDPSTCLDQSTRNGWTDVYGLKEKTNGSQNGSGQRPGTGSKSFHQRDVEEAERVKQAVRARLVFPRGGAGLDCKPDKSQADGGGEITGARKALDISKVKDHGTE